MVDKSPGDILIEVGLGQLKLDAFDVGVQTKYREPNKAKFNVEEIKGRAWASSLGHWVSYYRKIDRNKDLYVERVVDEETGNVLRDCEEPLSKHTGRGSTKTK